jgi:2-dehydro-3-deoxyphosphooctonate aldolase (KDO 8-P synthase)
VDVQLKSPLFRREGSLIVVAGPCVLEDRALNVRVARHLAETGRRLGVPVVFKASFDKANRTSLSSPRGPGLREGTARLREVREETGLPVLTDVHETGQVDAVADAVDVLQIPAFLSRQTDLILAAAGTGLPVNLKKGQWMAPEDMAHTAAKAREGGATDLAVTERGTAFGYGRWVVDMRSFTLMREACGCPALFDATHAVQLPGAAGGASGGERRFVEVLARAAVAAGADGLYLEVHPEPSGAPSDAASMLPLARLEPLLEEALAVREALARGRP